MSLLKRLAEEAYIMGLATIGEAATHRLLHYDAYWIIGPELGDKIAEFTGEVSGHEDDSIDLYLTAEDKQRLDAELDEALGELATRTPGEGL